MPSGACLVKWMGAKSRSATSIQARIQAECHKEGFLITIGKRPAKSPYLNDLYYYWFFYSKHEQANKVKNGGEFCDIANNRQQILTIKFEQSRACTACYIPYYEWYPRAQGWKPTFSRYMWEKVATKFKVVSNELLIWLGSSYENWRTFLKLGDKW